MNSDTNRFIKEDSYDYLNLPRIKTVEEWELILINELKFEKNKKFSFINDVLIEMYKEENHTVFCSDLERKNDIRGLNLRVGEFRDRIRKLKEISFPIQIRKDLNTDRAWNIPFKSSEAINNRPENKGKFCWILREELVEAMERLIPGIKEYKAKQQQPYAPIEFYNTTLQAKSVSYVDINDFVKTTSTIDYAKPNKCTGKLPQKTDYTKKQIRNKLIGDSGEEKILQEQKEALKKAGRSDLAKRAHIVDSDAYGYDIESFDIHGNPKHIEVKTTTSTQNNIHFYITSHEIDVIKQDNCYELHYLCCVNEDNPKIIVFSNKQLRELINSTYLKPTQYEVTINP